MPYPLGASIKYLIKGNATREILKTLALNFPLTFTLREIARLSGLNINAVVHGYKQLEKARIVVNTSRTRTSAITLNQEHPFFMPIMELIHKSYGIGYGIHKYLDNLPGISTIILTPDFLYATNRSKFQTERDNTSTYNRAYVVFIGTPEIIELSHRIELLEQQFNTSIPITVFKPSDAITRLRAQDQFLWGILSDLHIFLKGSLASIFSSSSQ